MTTYRITLRLARNPGTEFADGDDHRGYTLTAPLTADDRIDAGALKSAPASVRRFAPDEDAREGVLKARGGQFYFDYGDQGDADEPLYRVGEHRLALGEYVSITDEEGRLLTYKVTEVVPVQGA